VDANLILQVGFVGLK